MRDKIVTNLFIVLKAFISIFFPLFLYFSFLVLFFFFIERQFTVNQLELPPSDSSVQLLDNWNITLDTVWLFSFVILPRDHVQNDDFRFIYFFRFFFQLKKKNFKTFQNLFLLLFFFLLRDPLLIDLFFSISFLLYSFIYFFLRFDIANLFYSTWVDGRSIDR